jgi:hypothetical protein
MLKAASVCGALSAQEGRHRVMRPTEGSGKLRTLNIDPSTERMTIAKTDTTMLRGRRHQYVFDIVLGRGREGVPCPGIHG